MQNRPRYTDKVIAQKLAQSQLTRVSRWASEDERMEELEQELADAIERSAPLFEADEIARHLEKRHFWATDKKLVDILESVAGDAYLMHSEAVAEWVKSNGILPKKSIGDVVDVKPRPTDPPLVQMKGEITRIDEIHGTYTVYVPARGHVKSGLGTHGNILPFEDFHELATPPEEFVLLPQ